VPESAVMIFFLTGSTDHLRSSFVRHGCGIGRYETFAFADGERGYRLKDTVKGESVAIVASVLPGPESLFNLLALHRLVVENGAARVTLIVPYLGYARQDRPTREGEASIGVMVAELLRNLNAHRLMVFDLHSDPIRRALGPSAVELSALPLFAAALRRPPQVIVSPDAGAVPRTRILAKFFDPRPELAVVDKVRPRANMAVAKRLQGNVRGKNVLILDDMIDTGGTLTEAVNLLSDHGAAHIRIAATHGIFSGGAKDRLSQLSVSGTLITSTLCQMRYPKMRILDIVPLILDALSGC